jgi:hypothetical protein
MLTGPQSVVHRPLTVRAQSGGRIGWRNVCTCGQRSGLLESRRDAHEYGRFHLAYLTRPSASGENG